MKNEMKNEEEEDKRVLIGSMYASCCSFGMGSRAEDGSERSYARQQSACAPPVMARCRRTAVRLAFGGRGTCRDRGGGGGGV